MFKWVLNTPLNTIVTIFFPNISKVKVNDLDFFSTIYSYYHYLPETYLEPSQTSTMDLFLRK